MDHLPVSLHGDTLPRSSHTRNFQKPCCREDRGLPPYGIWIVSAPALFPLSHRSPSFRSSRFGLEAVRIQ